jgi:hypothetical protein
VVRNYWESKMEYSDYDRDILIRTVLGEAGGESGEGQQAVAHVILNRARDPRWPSSVSEVALQPKQFSAWNKGSGGNTHVNTGPGTPAYEAAGAQVDAVLAGQSSDVTGGATHYWSPAGMEKHVEDGEQNYTVPKWAAAETERRGGQNAKVGGHVFTGQVEGYDGEDVPPQYVYNPEGRPADVPPPQSESPDVDIPVPPMDITGVPAIDGAIADGLGAAKESAIQMAIGSVLGGGGSAPQMSAPAPPPMPTSRVPMPRPVSGMGETIFKIQRPKERDKK